MDDKDRELARLRDENTQLTLRLRECQQYRMWVRDLMANESLGAGEKVALVALRDVQAQAANDRNEPQADPDDIETDPDPEQTDIWKVARRAGCSPQAAGDRLQKLAIAGAVKRTTRLTRGEGGTPLTLVHVAPTLAALRAPRTIAYPEELQPNRGGKRQTCPHCKSENLRRRVVCADCGSVLSDKPVNEPDMPHVEENSRGSHIDLSAETVYDMAPSVTGEMTPGIVADMPHAEENSRGSHIDLRAETDVDAYPLDHVAAGRRAVRAAREACPHPRHAIRFLPLTQKWRCGHCNEDVPEPADGQVVVWPRPERAPATA